MDPNSMNSILSLLTVLAGLYCFCAWFQLRKGTIPEKFLLLSKELPADQCLDQEQYTTYLRPRLLVIGAVTTVFGGFTLLDDRFSLLEQWCPEQAFAIGLLTSSILPLAAVIWFCFCLNKIQRELW